MSRPIDSLSLYLELCDLAAEAGAVDTVIGRPEVLVRRIGTLRDLVGSMAHDVPIHSSQAAGDVLAERERQIAFHGWTAEHDDEHNDGSLAHAAASYANVAGDAAAIAARQIPWRNQELDGAPDLWPPSWDESWWRPSTPRRNLVKAAALILAEIERLDRVSQKAVTP